MSLAGVTGAIGLLADGLGIIGFLQDQIPEMKPMGTVVNVKAGFKDQADADNLGGDYSTIVGYDVNNQQTGNSDHGSVAAGGFITVTLNEKTPGLQSKWIAIDGQNNAICIAWITVSPYDDTVGGAWTGDIGFNCGQTWFENSQSAGYIDKDGPQNEENLYYPKCSWIDADHTNGIPTASLKFRTLAYGTESADTLANNHACDATLFSPNEGEVVDAPPGKRSLSQPRPQWVQDKLVVSNITQHSAKLLCSSATSLGPDFVSEPEGYFCDMETKTLSPLCSNIATEGCINVDSVEKRVTKRTTVAKRAVELAHKSYQGVEAWEY